MDAKERVSEGAFLCRMVLEVVGSPADYVEQTIKEVVKHLKEEKGVDVIKEQINEVVKQEKHFTTFAELEVLFKNISTMLGVCFDYMPSSMEIIEPEDLNTKSNNISQWMNDLLGRLHAVEMRLKNTTATAVLREKNSNALLKNTLVLLLTEGGKKASELSNKVGIIEEQLIPFLERFTKEGFLKKEDGKYSLK